MIAGGIVAALVLAGVAGALAIRRRSQWWRRETAREARRLRVAGIVLPERDTAAAVLAAQRPCPYLCPVCRQAVERFLPSGEPGSPGWRDDARCPSCGALERHRLGWLYLLNATDLYDGYEHKAVLALSADGLICDKLREGRRPARLLALPDPAGGPGTALDRLAAERDGGFDLIYACGGLETVPDDAGVLAHLRRVLAPGASAIFQTAPFRDETIERPPDGSAAGGPLRVYGRDFADRLDGAGFTAVTLEPVHGRLGGERAARYGLRTADTIHRCVAER